MKINNKSNRIDLTNIRRIDRDTSIGNIEENSIAD